MTIELLTAVLGGEIGPGIVGLVTGPTAGLAVAVTVASVWSAVGGHARAALLADAGFGLTLGGLALLRYVHFLVIAEHLVYRLNLTVAALVAIVIGVGARMPAERPSV